MNHTSQPHDRSAAAPPPRQRTLDEREAEWQFRSAWDEVMRHFGDDGPDGPLHVSYRAAWAFADYWKARALNAEHSLTRPPSPNR